MFCNSTRPHNLIYSVVLLSEKSNKIVKDTLGANTLSYLMMFLETKKVALHFTPLYLNHKSIDLEIMCFFDLHQHKQNFLSFILSKNFQVVFGSLKSQQQIKYNSSRELGMSQGNYVTCYTILHISDLQISTNLMAKKSFLSFQVDLIVLLCCAINQIYIFV